MQKNSFYIVEKEKTTEIAWVGACLCLPVHYFNIDSNQG